MTILPIQRILSAALLLLIAFTPTAAQAAVAGVPARYTNDNFWSAPHDKPATFSFNAAGEVYGTTETGKTFRQVNVANAHGVRLQRFEIDDAYFYVSDRGIIRAESDLTALSIYVSRA